MWFTHFFEKAKNQNRIDGSKSMNVKLKTGCEQTSHGIQINMLYCILNEAAVWLLSE